MSDVTPFNDRSTRAAIPTRVLHRFRKPGHVAEIRERIVTQWRALEYLVFIDGDLSEGQMFHGAQTEHYASGLEARVNQFLNNGWQEERVVRDERQL